MNILITNDDGYEAKGINVLFDILSKKHNVYMIAPDSNRSAVSSHFSFFNKLTVKKVEDHKYCTSGFPADCIFEGLMGNLFNEKIDLVISGINNGSNLGTDIIYSGTCAAARQAVLLGCPGIALSTEPEVETDENYKNLKFVPLASFVEKNLDKLYEIACKIKDNCFLNINGQDIDKYKGVGITGKLCKRKYYDSMEMIEQQSGMYVTDFKSVVEQPPAQENDDNFYVKKGFVSISAITVEPSAGILVDDNTFSL